MSLPTTIAGIHLNSCLMNAAGCNSSTHHQLDLLSESLCGAIVTKSGTIHSREGNAMPRQYLDKYGSINSIGLANPSYMYYMDSRNISKPYIRSIYPFNTDELSTMLTNIKQHENREIIKLVEVNLSCPNVHANNYFEEYNKYFDLITQLNLENVIVGIKMAPLFDIRHYQEMSHMLLKNNIKFITCCNTLPGGLMIDHATEQTVISPTNGLGGIGGLYLKPIALANVYNFSMTLHNNIDIIGCGGIKTGCDVMEFILCGARAVQIGTQFIREGTKCFDRIDQELQKIIKSKKYKSIDDFCGTVTIRNPKL